MRTNTIAPPAPYDTRLRLLVLLGLLVGFGLRLFRLGAESFWYDETVSVYLARLPLGEMVRHTAGDIHPPGYYALLHLWQQVTAPTLHHGLEWLFAWPSVWCGLLILPLLVAIARRLFGVRAAVAALWVAALSPFQLWFSQEVRMYTLGALLGLLCLWALLQFLEHRHSIAWLALYSVAAAAGLYTLYYFAFLLVALNLLALLWVWLDEPTAAVGRGRRTVAWLAAQLGVLLLWLPWLPVFWRQATDPPVPPWRTPWSDLGQFGGSVAETLTALLVGQTPPGRSLVPWAIVAVLLVAGFVALTVATARRRTTGAARRRTWLAAATVLVPILVPILLLYGLTWLATPVYHVRYLFVYASMFAVLVGCLVAGAWRLRRWLGLALAGVLALTYALGLVRFWSDPLLRADDHRTAVARLAQQWRPGDAILANAGWVYPILATYWPSELASPGDSTPPPIAGYARLTDEPTPERTALAAPWVLRTGSVDGDTGLGWGDPSSDFFAMPLPAAEQSLAALAEQAQRLWHYRLYDTVSDPQGEVRAWLAEHATLVTEEQVPGRDYGMVQLYSLGNDAALTPAPADVRFGDALQVVGLSVPPTATAGNYLYVTLEWQALPGVRSRPAPLSMSLRLYDAAGEMAAQADSAPAAPTNTWQPGERHVQMLALPVPGNLAPGSYSVELIVYPQDGSPPLAPSAASPDGQRWQLAGVEVQAR